MKSSVFYYLLTIVFCFAYPVAAQESLQLEEIRVTAQKQEEDLQDVSTSITVFTGTEIEDRNISSVADIAVYTANFMIFDTGIVGLYNPSIRGIQQEESGGSPVGLFVDGVPILTPEGFSTELLDIERIEVLRGPQGALYGANTEAGAINITTKQPDNEFSAKSSIEYGEDHKLKFIANVKCPIKKDKFYGSLSALHYEKDGYIRNTHTGEYEDHRNYDYAKGILRWTPSQQLDISFGTSHLRHDDGDQSLTLTPYGAMMSSVAIPKNKREVDSDLVGWNKSESNMQSLSVKWDISEALKLNSITTRREYRSYYLNDWDLGVADPLMFSMHLGMDTTFKKYSQELRLNWKRDKTNIVSGIYFDMDDDTFERTNDTSKEVDKKFKTENETIGLFFHGERKITERLKLLAGLRYDRKEGEFEQVTWQRKADEEWDEFSPKLTLEYDVDDNIMTYAGASKGYRAGGFNEHATENAPPTFDEETLISYEIGIKSIFLDKRIMVNTSVYYMDIDDIQVKIEEGYGFNYKGNAAKAWSAGFETDFRARLTKEITLSGSFGYNRTEFDDYEDAQGNYDGNRNPFAPEYSYSLDMTYRNHKGFFSNLALIGYGSMYLDKENKHERDAYSIVKAKIGYETEKMDIYFYANNLFEEEYDAAGYFGGYYVLYSPPRETGVQLTLRF